MKYIFGIILLFGFMAAFIGCGGNAPAPLGVTHSHTEAVRQTSSTPSPSPIKHIIIVIQENRSFDNLFNGFPGADTVRIGKKHDGTSVSLTAQPLAEVVDISHTHTAFKSAYDGGKNDGFDLEHEIVPKGATPPPATFPYSYSQQTDVQPYWTLGQQYTLADRMFQSNTGPSFPAHQYLIAARSAAAENPCHYPWGCDSPAGTLVAYLDQKGNEHNTLFPCFDYQTVGDLLDANSLAWRYYAPTITSVFNGYDAIKHIRYGSDWPTRFVSPETTFFKDVAAGKLAPVTWIVPAFLNSDHAGARYDWGPAWVTRVVNAVGSSKFWASSAILVVWDDWGGWYDHVAPPQLDYMGLGFRVPLLVISPFSKHGYISHVQHEFGSVARFIETTYGLPSLGMTDARSDDLADCFDFTQTPKPYKSLASAIPDSVILNVPDQDPDSDQ